MRENHFRGKGCCPDRRRLRSLAAGLCGVLVLAGCATPAAGPNSRGTSALALDEGQTRTSLELRLARAARQAGDLVSAINLYRSVVAARPDDADLKVELGDVMLQAGAPDSAVSVYEQVDHQSAARLDAEIGMGRAQLALSEPEAALDHFTRAGLMASDDHRMLIGRGVALDLLGRHAEAQASYREVLRSDPQNVAAKTDLALSLGLSGKYGEAKEILLPLARSAHATPRIRQNLALIYGLEGDVRHADQLSRIDLNVEDVQTNLRFFERVRRSKP